MYFERLYKKVTQFIDGNKKVDMYQCEVVIKSNGITHSTWQFRYSEAYGEYPTRRRIIKAVDKSINIHDYIKKYNLKNVSMVVFVWCKIGTFKKKQLPSYLNDSKQKVKLV